MRKKIHKNLVGIAALAIILTIGLTFWAYFMMLQKQIFQDLQTDVHVLASSDYIVDTLEQNYDANADGLRITLISKDGSVLYESKGNASKMENHMERPEVQQALKNGEGKATRRSNTIGTLSFYYAEKLENGCIIRVSRDIPYVAKLSVYLIPEGIAIFAGIFVLCLILGHIMTKRFIEPIEMLAVDVEKVSEMQTYPEIQPFIETINQQHRELKRNSKMRQEFTANVSHELKTPLTSISGYAELIESGIAQGEDTVRFAGEMGIGNTTTSSAMTAVYLGLDVETVTGRGAGLSSHGLQRKIHAIKQAIAVNQPDPEDPLDVLAKVGGLDIAGMCGLFLGGAAQQIPVVMDGFISQVAALTAMRLVPECADYILASHVSEEPGANILLKALEKDAFLTCGMRLGEGSGAVALFPILDFASDIYHKMSTFVQADIVEYQPLD